MRGYKKEQHQYKNNNNSLKSGKEDLQLKEYNLNKLLADMPYVIETRIGSKPIKLEFDIDQNIASKLIGDTTKIYRVIMNILTNSVKYTEVGKIKLTIKVLQPGSLWEILFCMEQNGHLVMIAQLNFLKNL